jgi:hypothetical protein
LDENKGLDNPWIGNPNANAASFLSALHNGLWHSGGYGKDTTLFDD